jgi:hypothetical protein
MDTTATLSDVMRLKTKYNKTEGSIVFANGTCVVKVEGVVVYDDSKNMSIKQVEQLISKLG